MGIEFELKFSADAQKQAAIMAAYPVAYEKFEMETTYFDTAAFDLSDRHITLRRRMENGKSVCTVKTPVSGFGRGEWDCESEDINEAIVTLCNNGAPMEILLLTAQGISPVCGARFTRYAGIVEHKGAVLELAIDAGVLMGGGKEIPLCEVEVELKSGEPEAAVDFGEALAKQFDLTVERKSKFRRAKALARG